MDDNDNEKKAHRKRQAGPKAVKKKAKTNVDETLTARQRNPKAFSYQSVNKVSRAVRRTLDIREHKHHIPVVDRTPVEPPPVLIAVVGPPKVGKTTLIQCLVRNFTRQKLTSFQGPVTVVSGKKRRLTFIECNNDISCMIDVAKVADLVLLLVDAAFGFEMEIFEFLNILQVHGFPKIMGVLTHLDSFRQNKQLNKTKKRLKHRFWTEVYQGAKLFYLSGIINGEYPKTEVQNLGRFISVMKFRPLQWKTTHPYLLSDRMEDVTDPEVLRQDVKADRSVCVYGYVRGTNFRNFSSVHVPGCGDFSIHDMSFLPDPCPLPDKGKKRMLNEKERLIYAPMSGVGGIVYDKDAVYIELGGSHSHTAAGEQESNPGNEFVSELMDAQVPVDQQIATSQLKLFKDAAPMSGMDVQNKIGPVEEKVTDSDGRVRRKATFADEDGSDDEEEDDDEGSDSEEEGGDDEDIIDDIMSEIQSKSAKNKVKSLSKPVASKKKNEEESFAFADSDDELEVEQPKKTSKKDLEQHSSMEDEAQSESDGDEDESESEDVRNDDDESSDDAEDVNDEDISDDKDDDDNTDSESDEDDESSNEDDSEQSLIKKKKQKDIKQKKSAQSESEEDSDSESEEASSESETETTESKRTKDDSSRTKELLGKKRKLDSSETKNKKLCKIDANENKETAEEMKDIDITVDEGNDSDNNEEEDIGELKWKDNLTQKASDSFYKRQNCSVNWRKLVYGNARAEDETEAQGEELGGLFKVTKQTSEEKQSHGTANALDCSRFVPEQLKEWDLQEVIDELKDCFVTGTWDASKDAETLLKKDDQMFGDFEDLETGEKVEGAADSDDDDADSESEKEDTAEQVEKDTKLTRQEKVAAKRIEKKKRMKELFDEAYDEDGTAGSNYFETLKGEMNVQAKLNREEFESLDEQTRAQYEGFRPGVYVRVQINKMPCEFVTNFDPTYPVILGGLLSAEQNVGYVQVRIKKHRWHKRILKTRDPLVLSVGWRRFQTMILYSMQDHNMRNRLLKYTPEHLHCHATFWGPITPQGTGVLGVQTITSDTPDFRISATGAVVELDKSMTIVKKLKLTGTPYKIYRKTAFIQGMFNSSLEVAKFEGSNIRTVSGVRGQIKKAVQPEGSFRATFEDKIMLSDIAFVRTWYPVEVTKLYNPVTTLLLPGEEKNKWQGMKTLGQLKREKGIRNKVNEDHLYKDIERKPKFSKPLIIPKALQRDLPFKDKPKVERQVKDEVQSKRIAVVREPHQRKVAKLMAMMKTLHEHKMKMKKVQMQERVSKHHKKMDKQQGDRNAREKKFKKEVFRLRGKAEKKKEAGARH